MIMLSAAAQVSFTIDKVVIEGRLNQHLDTAEASRAASLAVLRERRAKGQSSHPCYWAGFVTAGEWR